VDREEQSPEECSFRRDEGIKEFEEKGGAGKNSKRRKKLRRPSRPRFLIVVFPWDEGRMPRRGLRGVSSP